MAVETRLDYAVTRLTNGAEVSTPLWRLDTAQEGESFLVIAAQHGNEVQGCEVVRRFKEVCERELKRGTVWLVPFANLPAVRHRRSHISLGPEQAYADDQGHNMNRTWPGKPEGNDTERLAHSVHEAVVKRCTRCLDLHSWSRFTATCTLARHTHPISRAMAEVSGIRFVQWRAATGPLPGGGQTIGGLFNNSGRAAITIELAPQWVIREKEVAAGLRAATNLAKLMAMMDGEPELPDGPLVEFGRDQEGERKHEVKAPCTGLFVEAGLETSDFVEEGQKLGHLICDRDLSTVELLSPASGYLWTYGSHRADCDVALPPQHPYASEGELLATVIQAQ